MNPIFVVTLVAIAIVFFMAFKGIRQNSCFENADVKNFNSKIQAEKDAVILDVRTPAEVAQGAIKGAINLDVSSSNFKEKIAGLDKSKTYLVYCRSGARSARACSIMCESGFSKLVNLQGGFMAWSSNQGKI
jgi:rhodanese-related sulfurtransferase